MERPSEDSSVLLSRRAFADYFATLTALMPLASEYDAPTAHGYFQWELAPVLDSIWFAEGFGQYAAIMALAAEMPDPVAYREGMLNRRLRLNRTVKMTVFNRPNYDRPFQ